MKVPNAVLMRVAVVFAQQEATPGNVEVLEWARDALMVRADRAIQQLKEREFKAEMVAEAKLADMRGQPG